MPKPGARCHRLPNEPPTAQLRLRATISRRCTPWNTRNSRAVRRVTWMWLGTLRRTIRPTNYLQGCAGHQDSLLLFDARSRYQLMTRSIIIGEWAHRRGPVPGHYLHTDAASAFHILHNCFTPSQGRTKVSRSPGPWRSVDRSTDDLIIHIFRLLRIVSPHSLAGW